MLKINFVLNLEQFLTTLEREVSLEFFMECVYRGLKTSLEIFFGFSKDFIFFLQEFFSIFWNFRKF